MGDEPVTSSSAPQPQPRRRGPGRPFQKGQSGNPNGLPKAHRATREAVKDALDKAFTLKDGSDALVTALVAGVHTGDPTCIKLACEYRWGKPAQALEVSGADGEPLGISLVRDAATEILRDPTQRLALRAAIRGEN